MVSAVERSARRKAWARTYIQRGKGSPMYGTPEWLALPDDHPGKVAACVRAAECWATEGDEYEGRIEHELDALALAHKRIDDAEFVAAGEAHAHRWRHLTDSHRALMNRRAPGSGYIPRIPPEGGAE